MPADTVQVNMRLLPEHADLLRRTAARLRSDSLFAGRLGALLASDEPAPLLSADVLPRLEALERYRESMRPFQEAMERYRAVFEMPEEAAELLAAMERASAPAREVLEASNQQMEQARALADAAGRPYREARKRVEQGAALGGIQARAAMEGPQTAAALPPDAAQQTARAGKGRRGARGKGG